ncbi:MAG: hypothetical protein ABI690_27430 [Chloroflexota bacterium]
MAESVDALRKMVVAEVRKKREIAENQAKQSPAKMLGMFIEANLANLKMTPQQFAKELDIESILADAVITGFLPASEIDDDFLVDIATVLGHEPNTLRILLRRVIVPTFDRSDEADANPASV